MQDVDLRDENQKNTQVDEGQLPEIQRQQKGVRKQPPYRIMRWWAERVGKGNLVKPNADYGIRPRSHVSDGTKRRDLDAEKLARVKDPHVRMALRLQGAFGLRREEAIKLTPARDDRGDRIRLKGATTKGGRPREVPVLTDGQRRLLDEARELAGGGALIPPGRNYAEQKRVYEDEARHAGLDRNHGLRHAYALDRYEALTGWKAPAAGGPASSTLWGARRGIDRAARLTVAAELGHSRREISRTYLGA